jgi:hypothetical protein
LRIKSRHFSGKFFGHFARKVTGFRVPQIEFNSPNFAIYFAKVHALMRLVREQSPFLAIITGMQNIALILITAAFILLSHYLAVFPHEYAHLSIPVKMAPLSDENGLPAKRNN